HQMIQKSKKKKKNKIKSGLDFYNYKKKKKNFHTRRSSEIEKRRQGIVRHFFQKSMKLKIWNYIHQSTRNSTRNTKNTLEGGLACVVCEIRAKNANLQKRTKIEKEEKG